MSSFKTTINLGVILACSVVACGKPTLPIAPTSETEASTGVVETESGAFDVGESGAGTLVDIPTLTWLTYSGSLPENLVKYDTAAGSKLVLCMHSTNQIGWVNESTKKCVGTYASGTASSSATFSVISIYGKTFAEILEWKAMSGTNLPVNPLSLGKDSSSQDFYGCALTVSSVQKIGSYLKMPSSAGCLVNSGSDTATSGINAYVLSMKELGLSLAEQKVIGENQYLGVTEDATTSSCTLQSGVSPTKSAKIGGQYSINIAENQQAIIALMGVCGHAQAITVSVYNAADLQLVVKRDIAVAENKLVFNPGLSPGDYRLIIEPKDSVADYFFVQQILLFK